ncbi:MAG: IS1634 family transposase [Desulfobacterales bacterium]|nr:IS1634 family transposase [Desulfobacterales bacterium]
MNNNRRVHLEIQTHRKNPRGLIRTSFRKDGKNSHETISTLTGLSFEQLKLIQAALQGNVVLKKDFVIKHSKEYGASYALLQLAKDLELDKMIYSRTSEKWVQDSLAMIIGKVIYAGSKLSLTRIASDSCLWDICGVNTEKIDVNLHCYKSMDELFKRQNSIQKKLAMKHLNNNSIILYDITSSYLEGLYEDSEIVAYGYNRDKKKGHEQIVIGLICNSEGCPIAVEVFRGNTKDESTIENKIAQIKKDFGIQNAIFVGDRGMITKTQFNRIQENEVNYIRTISALTHSQLANLCEQEFVQMSMFDEKEIIQVIDPDNPQIRYGLSKNAIRGRKDKVTRENLIKKTEVELEKISNLKRPADDATTGIRVGKIINKYKVGKLLKVEIKDGKISWERNQNKIQEAEALDGLYVIFTDVKEEEMNISEIVQAYRKLIGVEQAFRNLKTAQLEIRPIYHKTDERIKCHIFLCMLAYYLMWNAKQRLLPLFEADQDGQNKKYTFEHIIERLKSIRKETVEIEGVATTIITECDEEQQLINDYLNVKIK